MTAYYNEHDRFAAAWLRELIKDGHIAPGDVDERDIQQVTADDLRGYTQCHFFAGIGGWSYALRLAGYPDDRAVWSGSCPCQPLSSAGQRKGHADERHLWPAFYRLIAECAPSVVFGEQVGGTLGYEWLAGIRADLEHGGYAVGAADLPAASVGAPHIRQRVYWMAVPHDGSARGIESTDGISGRARSAAVRTVQDWRVADAGGQGLALGSVATDGRGAVWNEGQAAAQDGLHSFWSGAEWLTCFDGKARRVEPGIFPLAHGLQSALDSVYSLQDQAWSEVRKYAERREANPDQVLRMVRDAVCPKSRGQEQATGVRVEFLASPVLLNFLFDIEATRDRTAHDSRSKAAGYEIVERAVRSVRRNGGSVRSPHQRPSEGQQPQQPPETVHELSLVLARIAEAHADAAVAANAASNRVGLLRGAGNAIVPQVAAQFIGAWLDVARPLTPPAGSV